MTETNRLNREKYLELLRDVWDFDEASMKYMEYRTSDEWRPPKEFDKILNLGTFEDQRIVVPLNMAEKSCADIFEDNDKAFSTFKSLFSCALEKLEEEGCYISYLNFLENKCIYKKNLTKIKKVLESIYTKYPETFRIDFSISDASKETISDCIVKQFEIIGANKKSANKISMVFSFNPMDWLLSSTAETWSSCFNLNNPSGGFQYCLGIPFYSGDPNRMMIYITDGRKKNCLDITVDRYITRTWCMLDKSDKFCVVKWYPNNTIGIDPIKTVTGNNSFCAGTEFNQSKYPLEFLSTKKGIYIGAYSDLGELKNVKGKLYYCGNEKTGQQIFHKSLLSIGNFSNTSVNFGTILSAFKNVFNLSGSPSYRIPSWKKFGLHVDMLFLTPRCSICKEEKVGLFFDNNFFCFDCYKDNFFECELCGSKHSKDKAITIELYNGSTINVCGSCADKYINCTSCSKKARTSEMKIDRERNYYCPTCVDKLDFKICDSCSYISKNINYVVDTFENTRRFVCEDCGEEYSNSCSKPITFGRYYQVLKGKLPRGVNV